MRIGSKHSLEARQKMSLSGRGRKKTEEHKLKISLANTGKCRTIESRQKQSLTMRIGFFNGTIKPSRGSTGISPWNKGLTKDDPRVAKYVQSGKNHYQFGIARTESEKRKISDTMKNKWKIEDRSLHISHIRQACASNKPTKIEYRLIKVCERYRLPFRYVGNGQAIIGHKNPDFICTDPYSKKLIDVFGSYWHRRNGGDPAYDRQRYFYELGWQCLIIWEDELKRMSDDTLASHIRRYSECEL